MKRNVSAKRSELCLDSSKIRLDHRWSFIGGSRISVQSNSYTVVHKKFSGVRASCTVSHNHLKIKLCHSFCDFDLRLYV